MSESILLADSGSTKAEWCFIHQRKKKAIFTQGISPYFLNEDQIQVILQKELLPKLKNRFPDSLYYYGTGCANKSNAALIRRALKRVFPKTKTEVTHDLMAAARALCGRQKGIACILGTGSNSCFYNGKRIVKNSPGLGYVLGDEGSGAYLGKKVIQHYLYQTFDEDLRARFDAMYMTTASEILENIYKKPFPNRYLARFTLFLAENRGHYMIENIIEDGLNDFFFNHLLRYPECRRYPVHFTGGVAFGFKDVLQQLCESYGFQLGQVLKNPMPGLIAFHQHP